MNSSLSSVNCSFFYYYAALNAPYVGHKMTNRRREFVNPWDLEYDYRFFGQNACHGNFELMSSNMM